MSISSSEEESRISDSSETLQNASATIWVCPSKEICTFVRDEMVDEKMKYLQTLKQLPELDERLDQCMRFWKNHEKPTGGLVPKTFEHLRVFLSKNGEPALTHGMGRLWPEDIMLLKPGDEVTMLIIPIHDIMFGGSKHVTGFVGFNKQVMEQIILADPLQPHLIGKTLYFGIRLIVSKNIYCDSLRNGRFDRAMVIDLLSTESGAGLELYAEADNFDGTSRRYENFTVLFANLFRDPMNIMFWKDEYDCGIRIKHVRKELEQTNDPIGMHAFYDVYSEYVYGDAQQTQAMLMSLQEKLNRTGFKGQIHLDSSGFEWWSSLRDSTRANFKFCSEGNPTCRIT